MDWFYGFKVHRVITDEGEVRGVKMTAGHVDDPDPVPELARALFGQLFGDRGSISQALFEPCAQDCGDPLHSLQIPSSREFHGETIY